MRVLGILTLAASAFVAASILGATAKDTGVGPHPIEPSLTWRLIWTSVAAATGVIAATRFWILGGRGVTFWEWYNHRP